MSRVLTLPTVLSRMQLLGVAALMNLARSLPPPNNTQKPLDLRSRRTADWAGRGRSDPGCDAKPPDARRAAAARLWGPPTPRHHHEQSGRSGFLFAIPGMWVCQGCLRERVDPWPPVAL
eukprot:128614-Rhodomonas_salina.3